MVNKIDELLEWQPSLAALSGKSPNSPVSVHVSNETDAEGNVVNEDASDDSRNGNFRASDSVGERVGHSHGDDRGTQEGVDVYDSQQSESAPDTTQGPEMEELQFHQAR